MKLLQRWIQFCNAHGASLAEFGGAILLLASLCNGATYYFKKIGVLQHDAYVAHIAAARCRQPYARKLPNLEYCASLIAKWTPPENPTQGPSVWIRFGQYLHNTSAWGAPLKVLKDLFVAALILLSATLVWTRRTALASFREAWPIYLLFGYFCAAFLGSFTYGAIAAVAGIRSMAVMTVILIGGCLAPQLPLFARWLVRLLLVEMLMLPIESLYGIPMHDRPVWGHLLLPDRVAGTFIEPNSLGVFAIVALSFLYAFSNSRSGLPLFGFATGVIILAAGSGTGAVGALLLLGFISIRRVAVRFREKRVAVALAGVIILAMAAAFLPKIMGRPRLYESLAGRSAKLSEVFRQPSALKLVFGRGLGVNSNTMLSLIRQGFVKGTASAELAPVAESLDSTVTALVVQVGIAGTLIFYGAILWAALKDRAAFVFYFTTMLCSLTINLTEFFPVNILLGVALARSALVSADLPVSNNADASPGRVEDACGPSGKKSR